MEGWRVVDSTFARGLIIPADSLAIAFKCDERVFDTLWLMELAHPTMLELGKTVLGLPLVVVVEAKQNNFIEGWGQCLAESIAAQKINKKEAQPVYSIVTDGELWQFGRLLYDVFTKEKTRIAITDLDKLFGVIGFLLADFQDTAIYG